MYEPHSHALLNRIIGALTDKGRDHVENQQELHFFFTRLGANFYAIHSLFFRLYSHREDFVDQLGNLVAIMLRNYLLRSRSLKKVDQQRESDPNWFLHQRWVGMALYSDGFAGDLAGVADKLHYLQELGINMLHIMPILQCPSGQSDGGYAVSNFRRIDKRVGSMQQLEHLSKEMTQRNMLLTLDIVLNHTSDEHHWAKAAKEGNRYYQDYYYSYRDRQIPDRFEEGMPEIFPENAPGNFTWNEDMQRWVMTVFNQYQWDLNYQNPAVFIEMLDIILFWANKGVDIMRLDAVAFLWKKIGRSCQNEREAHLILQLLKDCCQVSAPGVLFIAEAIVSPGELTKYFGEDAINAKECEMAYNATFMALLWDAVATKNARLLTQGIKSLPGKPDNATWLNYVRCHDDIGLGFDDSDIAAVGYHPYEHRRFLLNYFTGHFEHSAARGVTFGHNKKTGDARIAGTLASLIGLESALAAKDEQGINDAIDWILLLHGLILSFGGMPLLYYGDEVATINDYRYLDDLGKSDDARWTHRPTIDWNLVDQRNQSGTYQFRVFHGLKHLLAVRRDLPAFADFNNRQIIDQNNPALLVYIRTVPMQPLRERVAVGQRVVVVANFSPEAQCLPLNAGIFGDWVHHPRAITDLTDPSAIAQDDEQIWIPRYHCAWLSI